MVMEEWQSRASEEIRVCLDRIGIVLCPERFQSKWQSNRIPGCWLRSSVLFHGWLVAAMAKVEYFFINMLVRIDVSQGNSLTLEEVLVPCEDSLNFIPLHEVLEAFLANVEFSLFFFFFFFFLFLTFSFTHFAVKIDLLEFQNSPTTQ